MVLLLFNYRYRLVEDEYWEAELIYEEEYEERLSREEMEDDYEDDYEDD